MTAIKVHGGIDILRLPVNEEEHVCPPWRIKYTQSHILHSKCSKNEDGCGTNDANACQFCVYSNALELPHMPDMVFPNNVLSLKHQNGASLQFNALDALRYVSNGKINVQLACAEAWKESRSESSEYLEEKIKPFDWTFTTNYTGTISGFKVEETNERIDMDKLKQRDKIMFYHDLTLFEDELHDNGIAASSVKIVSPALFLEPSAIAPHLPLTGSRYDKLMVPEKEEVKLHEDTTAQNETMTEKKLVQSDEHTADSSIT
ncbi:TIP41-like protein isoform X3 [Temnothorax longispinosus]|uniref:TIP41-like protein isoform X3 n=1 Tax=Temnothorax longispinosus TaxID=300112 RepID=UPI003A99C0AD